ncbi:MAG: hypothetical protein WAV31_04915 [Candidatus Moraniibacteriota bacterium]
MGESFNKYNDQQNSAFQDSINNTQRIKEGGKAIDNRPNMPPGMSSGSDGNKAQSEKWRRDFQDSINRTEGLKRRSGAQNSNPTEDIKPTSTLSLIRLIKFSDVFFFLAILVAMAKDYLDFIGVGSLPLIGTLITLMTSITIFFAMLFCGSHSSFGSKKKMKLKIMKWFSLITGTGVEMFFFGVNFAPIETATACTAFTLILMERKDEAEAKKAQK